MPDTAPTTIQDAARILGLPMPGFVYHERRPAGKDEEGLQGKLSIFLGNHSGHELEATCGGWVRQPGVKGRVQFYSLICYKCEKRLHAGIARRGWRIE